MTPLLPLALACTPPPPEPAPEPAPAPPAASAPATGTRVVLLGTGTPVPYPQRSGPCTAIVAGGEAWLVDAGPGLVRRAAAAAKQRGIPELAPAAVHTVLLTHLHSDHTTGLPDLVLDGWVVGRVGPLQVVGPPGTQKLVDGILAAWSEDVALRTRAEGLPPLEVHVSETTGGPVPTAGGVTVTAFEVSHGAWEHALGYRFDGPDGRSVVVSGDTAPTEAVVRACSGCDLLVHEVYARAGFDAVPDPDFHHYHATFHTSAEQLGALAVRARPAALLLTHQLYFGRDDATLVSEVRAGGYAGPVTSGEDLGVY